MNGGIQKKSLKQLKLNYKFVRLQTNITIIILCRSKSLSTKQPRFKRKLRDSPNSSLATSSSSSKSSPPLSSSAPFAKKIRSELDPILTIFLIALSRWANDFYIKENVKCPFIWSGRRRRHWRLGEWAWSSHLPTSSNTKGAQGVWRVARWVVVLL